MGKLKKKKKNSLPVQQNTTMIIQRLFSNRKNKEMVRDWKLRERIKKSGVIDEINQERENKVKELTGGKSHATKLTEDDVFQKAKEGRKALQDKIKFDKGLTSSYGRSENADPELFKKVNKNSAGRSLKQVSVSNWDINTRINNKGSLIGEEDYDINGNKTSSGRAREIGLNSHGKQTPHMSGAEYHANRGAKKKAAGEVYRQFDNQKNNFKYQTGDKQKGSLITLKDKLKISDKEAKILKRAGKGTLIAGGVVAAGIGAKKLANKKKAKKESEKKN